MKKFVRLFLIVFLCLILVGCGCEKKQIDNKNEKEYKGNCNVLDCFSKINVDSSVDDVNKIIGFEGELTDEKYKTYKWDISNNESILVTYYVQGRGVIKAIVDNNKIKNSKIDFSKYDELRELVRKGISYSDFISYIGNVDGVLIEKNGASKTYIWVSGNGSYLKAKFNNDTNETNFVTGEFK